MTGETVCPNKFCSEHPHTLERLAGMEAQITGISNTIGAGVEELRELRNEIKSRPSWAVLAVITFLGGALGIVTTLLITHLFQQG